MLLILANRCGVLFPNQTTLGKNASIKRRRTNTLVRGLCEKGILKKVYRPNLTCIYYVADWLLHQDIRSKFKHLFKAFQFLCISLLFSSTVLKENCSRINDIRNYLNVYLKEHCHLTLRETLKCKVTYDCKRDVRKPLQNYSSPERTKLILELTKTFNLNRLGQIKLSPFPIEALQYAKDKFDLIQNPHVIRDGFGFFSSVCLEWC